MQELANALGAHDGRKLVTVFFDLGQVVIFGEQLGAVERRHARIDDHESLKVENALDVAQRHVEHHAKTAGQRLEEPDVGGRRGQLNVAHAFAANLALRHFDAALFADDAAVLQALVLATQALVVLDRAEDLGAEQAIALGLEGTVVDGLRLLHFTIGPGPDLLRRGQPDGNGVEFFFLSNLFE